MGFCKTKPALVYPYMEKLSLFHALHEYKVSVCCNNVTGTKEVIAGGESTDMDRET